MVDYKRVWKIIMFLALLLLIGFIITNKAYGLVIPHNNCTNISYAEFINFSDYEEGVLGVNVTYWEWACCPMCILNNTNCSAQELSFDLEPGENISGVQDNCYYDIGCDSCDEECDEICVVDRLLEPGDVYENLGGGCDVRARCVACEPCDAYSRVTEETKTFRVMRDNGSDILVFGNETTTIFELPISKAFSYDFQVGLVCPVYDIISDLEEHPGIAREVCYKHQPIIYSELALLEDSVRARDESMLDYQEQIRDCEDERASCERRAGTCTGESSGRVMSLETKLNSSDNALHICNSELGKAEGSNTSQTWLLVFLFIGFCISLIIIFLLYKRLKPYQRDLGGVLQ